MDYITELRIPRDRIAVLIGKSGEMKKQLEEQTQTKIDINSKEGDVVVKAEDSLKLYGATEVIKAIGRGFNPEVALLLLKQEYCFELINLKEYVKEKTHMQRLKGRIIGSSGKARNTMEDLTETHICVYGKTIGIIGEVVNVANAKRAVESLIAGSTHAAVYKWLEKCRRDIKKSEIFGI